MNLQMMNYRSDMDKLTIEQLKNYLGTGLKILSPKNRNGGRVSMSLHPRHLDKEGISSELELFKPAFYRLSDLDKQIPELGFVPIEEILKTIHITWYNSHLDSRYSEIEIDSSGNYVKAYFKYMATFEINIRINDIDNEKWWLIQQLFQWNFWIFDESYFDKGLIIDKLTYK